MPYCTVLSKKVLGWLRELSTKLGASSRSLANTFLDNPYVPNLACCLQLTFCGKDAQFPSDFTKPGGEITNATRE